MHVIVVDRREFNNQAILETIEAEKQPYLFTSKQLLSLVNLTPSVKTRLAIIDHIAPRLVDPRSEYEALVGLFRFSEEKQQVEEALKSRIQMLNHSIFNREGSSILSRGGRGRGLASGKSMYMGGRLGDRYRPMSLPIQLNKEDFDLPLAEDGTTKGGEAAGEEEVEEEIVSHVMQRNVFFGASSADRETEGSPADVDGVAEDLAAKALLTE